MFHSARPLSGRQAECQLIDGLRATARDELSGLAGEPGIGKARLLQIIPCKAQQFMAQRGSRITELHAFHAVALTQPAASPNISPPSRPQPCKRGPATQLDHAERYRT